MSALESWFNIENWNIKYSFHKFIGIKVGETTYTDFNTFKAVAENLINANPDGPKDNKISAEVVLEKNFTKLKLLKKFLTNLLMLKILTLQLTTFTQKQDQLKMKLLAKMKLIQ